MSGNEKEQSKMADPEVVPRAERKRFTAEEKLRILEEAEACTRPGEIGALVRREGIYSSYLSRWRRAREQGQLKALSSKKRGPKTSADKELAEEVVRLRRENERLEARLEQAEIIIEVQKKLSRLLGVSPETNESSGQT
jgi:transposase